MIFYVLSNIKWLLLLLLLLLQKVLNKKQRQREEYRRMKVNFFYLSSFFNSLVSPVFVRVSSLCYCNFESNLV